MAGDDEAEENTIIRGQKSINSTTMNKRKIEEHSSVSRKKNKFEIDGIKKFQCSMILNILIHKYGWAFTHPLHPKIKVEEKEIKATDKSRLSTKSYLMNVKHRIPPLLVVPQVKKVINSTTMDKRKIEVDSSVSYKKNRFEIDDNKEKEKKVEEIEVTNKSEPPKKLCLKIKLKLPPSKTINGELQKKQVSELTIVENKKKKLEEIKAIDKSHYSTESCPMNSTPLIVQQEEKIAISRCFKFLRLLVGEEEDDGRGWDFCRRWQLDGFGEEGAQSCSRKQHRFASIIIVIDWICA
ncbi:uncharacterized protein G2W53_003702 [Senna tora]|uniref:Uncharacterized protein n=1 Tax=Senna tora TaxID=362788 RepID=A0A834XAL0_9FABA|nr:uncharacterized protein G2W53_003702 [Senna tora]